MEEEYDERSSLTYIITGLHPFYQSTIGGKLKTSSSYTYIPATSTVLSGECFTS